MTDFHTQRERDSRASLETSSLIEGVSRQALPGQLARARNEGKISEQFTDDFLRELAHVSLDWEISTSGDGLRFERRFPYNTHFYDIRAWDKAAVAINLDPSNQTVAFRAYLYDQGYQEDSTIREGILVKEKEVVAFDQLMLGGGLQEMLLWGIVEHLERTRGKSGCIFDHLKNELEELPHLVQELSGGKIGTLAESFLQRVDTGELNVDTMPRLALEWPLPSHYLKEPEAVPNDIKRIEDNRQLSPDKKREKVESITSKDEVSAQELKELVYLIWNTFSEYPSGPHLVLPSKQNIEVSFSLFNPKENTAWITIYNGPDGKTGETVELSDGRGEPVWRIGIWNKYHSVILGKDIKVRSSHRDLMASEKPLNPEECAVVAKKLASIYLKVSSDTPAESLLVTFDERHLLFDK